jgi:hypothetical protein
LKKFINFEEKKFTNLKKIHEISKKNSRILKNTAHKIWEKFKMFEEKLASSKMVHSLKVHAVEKVDELEKGKKFIRVKY